MDKRIKTKEELSGDIWRRLKLALESRKISQIQLQQLCYEHGFRVSQPEISKLYTGKIQLNLYQLVAFSTVLGMSADYFIKSENEAKTVNVSGNSFIIDPEEEAFEGYKGLFYTVFHSTSSFDEKILHGKLLFSSSEKGPICKAVFELDTGEKDRKGHNIIKRYQGQLVISSKLGVGYCILVNERIGEISTIEFRHRNFFIKQVECRMGMTLTVSSGETKAPVVSKIFLSRKPIEGELEQQLIPFLKLEEEDVIISRESFQTLIQDEKDSNVDFDFGMLKNDSIVEEHMLINESMIRKQNKRLNRKQIAEIFSILKRYSEGAFLSGINEKEDSQTYELVCGAKNFTDD